MELRVFYVKHLDAFVIDVNVFQIVELLQDEVAGIVKNIAALVPANGLGENFEGDAVVQVLAGMDFETEVDADRVKNVENWSPAFCELVKGSLDQPRRTLRPRVEIRPCQRT